MDNLTGSIDLQVRYHLSDICPCSRHGFHSFHRPTERKETALQIERLEDPRLLVIEVHANLNILGRLEKSIRLKPTYFSPFTL